MILNYEELIESIAQELDRDDLKPTIAEWIQLAEISLSRYLDLIEGEVLFKGTLVIDQAYIQLPAGFKKAIHIELQNSPLRVLNVVSPDKRSDVLINDVTGRPRTITYIGRKGYLAPVPKTTEAYDLFYYGQPAPLSVENNTSELLEMGADVLKYAALMYSSPFLGQDERLPTWQQMFTEGRATLKREYWDAHAGGGILVIRPDFAPGDSHEQQSTVQT